MWLDLSDVPSGQAGIGMVFGQYYGARQFDWTIAMVVVKGYFGIPHWARQFCWFLGLGGGNAYGLDCDFGWRDTLARPFRHCMM